MKKNILIKVCGMRDPENIRELALLKPDMMGFIFFPASPRFVGNELNEMHHIRSLKNVKKTGVFVNALQDEILKTASLLQLDYIQLHGDENTDYCESLFALKYKLIKAFRIQADFDFAQTEKYAPFCRFFLFDTATANYGGSGKKFDWQMLAGYKGNTPFLLSGGIGPHDAEDIKLFSHPALAGIDLNSRFETSPGMKDIPSLQRFFNDIKSI